MNHRLILAAFSVAAFHPLVAQTPIACAGQLVPLKPPAMMSCQTATPVCLTDANGFNGHWVWGCPSAATNGGGFLDPSIISNGIQPPQINSPLTTMQQAERVRQLRLQNEQIRLQNQQMEQQLRQQQQEPEQARQDLEPEPLPSPPASRVNPKQSTANFEKIDLALKQGHMLDCQTEKIGKDALGTLSKMTCTILIDRK
jgi:hypothetical protein